MEFIDHTGHLFSLPEYTSYPIGWEYEENDYVFWIESQSTGHKLSTNENYFLPIRVAMPSSIDDISISLDDSESFMLVGSKSLNQKIEANDSIYDEIEISDRAMKTSLKKDDLIVIDEIEADNGNKFSVTTFYVTGRSSEETTWMTNVLIESNGIYCPITVGGEFHDETSELIVNGHNMGIWLPKEILSSLYQVDVKSFQFDEALLSVKMKELLLNYMHIKGECGNYESAKDSLKWFGYGDLISIRQLVQTDNQFLTQYVHDNFDVTSDNIRVMDKFRRSTGLSIWMDINRYVDEEDNYQYEEELIGEGKPKTEDLFSKLEYVVHDEGDIKFWKPYYDWKLQDMYLKMSMLSYYWKKYFLPLYTVLHSASMKQHCWMNDIKYIAKTSGTSVEHPSWTGDSKTFVKFNGSSDIYLYNQKAFFDKNYNEFTNSEWIGQNTDEEMIYINDVCARIPISFGTTDESEEETFFDVAFVLSTGSKKIWSSSFTFYQRKNDVKYENFILIPKSLVKKQDLSYWVDRSFRISICCNGNWHYHDFMLKVPQFQLKLGTLQYKYFNLTEEKMLEEGEEGWTDIDSIDTSDMTSDEIANINKVTLQKSLFTQVSSITDDAVNFNSYMYCHEMSEVNDVNFFDKLKYMIDSAESSTSSNVNKTIIDSNGSTISVNNYCEYLASKCYVYNVGLQKTQSVYKKGNSVVPMFMFNNGIKLGKPDGYSLSKLVIDVLFDVDVNNEYYAKRSYTLEDIDNATQPIIVNDLKSYTKIDDKELISRKSELSLKGLVISDIGEIDWDRTSLDWRKFYIDEHLRHKSSIVIRIVTTGEITLPNGRTYEFGGYMNDGTPRTYQDLPIKVWSSGDVSVCTMECTCPWAKECKFREENSSTPEYDYKTKEDPVEDKAKDEIMSANVKSAIDQLVSSMTNQIVVSNNKKYLNKVCIYDLYLHKMKRDKSRRLGLNISKVTRLKYESSIYDAYWMNSKIWNQTPELVEMYRMFFKDDGTCKLDIASDALNYDFYLMHDDNNWFVVLISQNTIDSAVDEDDLSDVIEYSPDDDTKIVMKKYRSSNRFLMNRMTVDYAYPANHFSSDDLIVATVDNVKFPFILDKTTKWSVKNLSLKYKSYPKLTSNINTMILSLYNEANANVEGYYDIDVRYSVDGNVNHQQKKHIRIFIKK